MSMKQEVPLEDRFDLLCDVVAVQKRKIEELEKLNNFLGESIIDIGSKQSALCELLISKGIIVHEELNHFIEANNDYIDEQIDSVEEDDREFRVGPKGDKIYK